MKKEDTKNLAFIDAQNLHFGTTKCNDCAEKLGLEIRDFQSSDCFCGSAWKVNLSKFRIYLKEKHNVTEAYYFLGVIDEDNEEMYKNIQKAGFIILFREHNKLSKSPKKGNVDTDIVFEIMKNLIDNSEFDKIVLVSGDGDYKKLVQYLIAKNKFSKVLFPNKKYASSLYKQFGSEFFDCLENNRTHISV